MNELRNFKNARVLNTKEQKAIKGGYACREPEMWCPPGSYCCFEMGGLCIPNHRTCPY